MTQNMSYTCDFETHKNLSHKQSVLFYGRMFVTLIIVKLRNMEYFTLSGEDITGAASETDPRLYYYSSYPELFLVDPTYCVQDG